jgi:hypothetical protein
MPAADTVTTVRFRIIVLRTDLIGLDLIYGTAMSVIGDYNFNNSLY